MFEPGEDTREAGERLAASYVNFYIANEAVLVPQFQDKHDKLACDILGKLFPDRRICPIDARAIIIGGGKYPLYYTADTFWHWEIRCDSPR